MRFFHRAALLTLLFATGCHAQQNAAAPASVSEDTQKRVAEEIREKFQVPPDVQIGIGKESASDMPGYETVPITFSRAGHDTTVPFLISNDHKILVRMEKFDLTKVKLPEEKAQEFLAKQPELTKGRPVRGNPDAKITIVNFDDFECPFCARMHQQLFPDIFNAYKDKVKVIYKDYPLVEIHPWAMHAAVVSNCLAAQSNDAYWDFADRVHGSQQTIGESHDVEKAKAALDRLAHDIAKERKLDDGTLSACIKADNTSQVEAQIQEGRALDIDSTPTLFINGVKVEGALPPEIMRQTINDALKKAGETVPQAAAENPAAKPDAKPSEGAANIGPGTAKR